MNTEMEEGKEDLPNNFLPGFITMDILSRLPTKSLMKFRCVSKSWKTLVIHNPLFVNMHLNRSIKEKIIKLIVRDDTELYSLEYKEKSDRCGWLVATKLHQLRDWIKILGSCNGLLCTMAKEYSSKYNVVYPLYIWNPSTRDYKQVPCTSSDSPLDWEYGLNGFGYSRKVNDYKIIKFKSVYKFLVLQSSRVDVYSLRYNSWRKLPNIPYIIWDRKSGELVNDCLHWRATSLKKDFYEPLLVIAFDIGDETFCEVPLLPDISTGDKYKIEVTTFDMQLCIVNIDKCRDAKVWVMKEYGVKESWTMLFNIHRQPGVKELGLNLNLLGLTKKGSVLITGDTFSGKKKVFSYDPKSTKRYNLQIKGLRLPKDKIEEKIEGLLRAADRARTYMESTVGVSINNRH